MDITQPDLIPYPWAANGQKASIPAEQTSAGNGRASWNTGFPIENTLPVSQGGVPANYQDFQGVLYTLSEFACYQQAGGIFTYSATLDYQPGARVLGSDGKVYRALAKNGPATIVKNPVGDTSGKWILEPNLAQTSSAALDVASNYVTSGGYIINNGFTVTGGVISGTVTTAQYTSKIGTSSTNIGSTGVPVYVSGGAVTSCVTADLQAGKDADGNVITSTYVDNTTYEADMAEKADINGYYSDMTVGNAEQLISDDYTTNDTPYVYRTAGGGVDVGDREVDKLVGGTIVWNQLCKNGNFENIQNWQGREDPGAGGTGWVTNETAQWIQWAAVDNELVVTTTADKNSGVYVTATNASALSAANGHKLLFKMDAWCNEETTESPLAFRADTTGTNAYQQFNITEANKWLKICAILQKNSSDQNNWVYVRAQRASQTIKIRRVQIFDLTAMFGTSIADNIFALEQANTGAGVAWFENQFRNLFYAYNAGSLQSVQAASHDMVGFNLWDEVWESGTILSATGENANSTTKIRSKNYIPIVPGQKYYFKAPVKINPYFYDADKNFMGMFASDWANLAYDLSTLMGGIYKDACYIRITLEETSLTPGTVCINLSWSGYRNGEYEPYEKHSYPLDSTLALRGVPKLNASNNFVYDGDTYASDGTVTRRYGIVDLGTLDWSYQTAEPDSTTNLDHFYSASLSSVIPNFGTNTVANIVCSYYVTSTATDLFAHNAGKLISSFNKNIQIYDSDKMSMSGSQFKASLSGVYLVYELAEPTTETATPYQNPQIVSDFGTEEYVDAAVAAGTRDVSIPVGHETKYIANLVDKLRRLPDAPDAAGNYLVHYDSTTRRASYIAYIGPTELPDAPSADGTYTLKATVADGVVTYSWEA